jgi:subtilisin-like proprotein convertase family protein
MYGQSCVPPFNFKFENRTTTSIDISWSDSNNAPEGWQLEIVMKGKLRTGIPTHSSIQKNIRITDLIPSTAYELNIRSVCGVGKYSNWNVAIPFVTVLEVPSACELSIPLKDNGTETLLLDVHQNGILGTNVFLTSVQLMIEHSWPADLNITLISPQGQSLVLSSHNGIGQNNFGDIKDTTCSRVTTFAPQSCLFLRDSKPPYIGTFKPDGEINNWKPDTLSKGYWKLIVFDRALKDAGILKYVNLNFNNELCLMPENFNISQTDFNSLKVGWKPSHTCKTIKLSVYQDSLISEHFVECNKGTFTINGLDPNTNYEISIISQCTFSISPESCKLKATTTCEPISVATYFDDLPKCDEGCAVKCPITDKIWHNVTEDSGQDWLIWQGKTDTENTGPNADVSQLGKYIYIENNPQLCGINNQVILQSTCMDIRSNPSGCDMSFYYNMYGSDINTLILEISLDNERTWQALTSISGNQGEAWKRKTISLSPYHQKSGIFRFKAKTGAGALADIAIDQIEFYNSMPLQNTDTYYLDQDQDGYGTDAQKVEICTSIVPQGYTTLGGDCDDLNNNIHPNATEIQCNTIDENCNGNTDDDPETNPMMITPVITHPSCNGSEDGQITLQITGGNAPYQVIWQNQQSGTTIQHLKQGIYYANVTDQGGCKTQTPYIQLTATTTLNVILTGMKNPTCKGKSDGELLIGHNENMPPYTYKWSNGATTKNLINTAEGIYSVTITDNNHCYASLNDISLTSKPSLKAGIKTIQHPPCPSQATGSIQLLVVNGTPPYQYRWESGQTTESISNLKAGIYTATVTDDTGCLDVIMSTITEPDSLQIKIVSTEAVRCYGENNGSIKTEMTGGTMPYTFLWSKLSERTDDIFNLEAGNYTLTITDANGCKVITHPISIDQPHPFNIEIDSIRDAICIAGKNGYVSVLGQGGNGDYNYVWSHSPLSVAYFEDLTPGYYSVTAYDKLGCKASIPNIELSYTNKQVMVDLTLVQANKCYLDKNAQVAAHISNAKQPLDFNWSHGVQYFKNSLQDTITKLGAGIYTLSITDVDGCIGNSLPLMLDEKSPYYYTIDNIINNVCPKDSNGSITLKVAGGNPPLGINWQGGLYAGEYIDGLANGHYSAQIIDANDCKLDVLPVPVISASNLQLHPSIQHDVDHKGIGNICLFPDGGLTPYNYLWSNGMTTTCIDKLMSGQYKLTLTDEGPCHYFENFIIENTSGTNEYSSQKIQIFPNPTFDNVNIKSKFEISELTIFDVFNNVFSKFEQVKQSELRLDFTTFTSGIYILKIKTQAGMSTFKVMKI